MNLFNFFKDPLDVSQAHSSQQALIFLIKNMSQRGYKFKPVVFLNKEGEEIVSTPLFVNLKKHAIRHIKIQYNCLSKSFEAMELAIPNNELKSSKHLKLVNQSNVILAY
jgi:hypothetical protein